MDQKLNIIIVLLVISIIFSGVASLLTLRQGGLKGQQSKADFAEVEDTNGETPQEKCEGFNQTSPSRNRYTWVWENGRCARTNKDGSNKVYVPVE